MDVNDDTIGKTYGRLKVKDIAYKKDGRTFYTCVCSCNNEITRIVRRDNLLSGNTISCGCFNKEKAEALGNRNSINLIGRRFGLLTVIGAATHKNGKAAWECVCDCGSSNHVVVLSNNLLGEKTTSCGCVQKARAREASVKDYVGQKVGYLTVVEECGSKNGRSLWRCRCQCGSDDYTILTSHDISSKGIISCGCKNKMSAGEYSVKEVLQESGVDYGCQVSLEGLVSRSGRKLSFDFIIYDQLGKPYAAIECQGLQHKKPIKYFGGEKRFKSQKENDARKRQYCDSNNIKLIEVEYKKLLCIDDLLRR